MTKQYSVTFFLSACMHLALLILLMYSANTIIAFPPPIKAKSAALVKAVTIDQASVDKQIKQIKAHERKQHMKRVQIEREWQNLRKKNKQAKLQLAKLKTQNEQLLASNKAQVKKVQEQQEKINAQNQKVEQEKKKAQRELSQLQRQRQQQNKLLQQLQKQTTEMHEKQVKAKKNLVDIQKSIQTMNQKAIHDRNEKLLRQQLAAEQALLTEQRNRHIQNELQKYTLRIYQAIASNWNIPVGVDPSLTCEFEINLANDGRVIAVKLVHSSGDAILDRSATTAIYRASPLPIPKDATLFKHFSEFNVKVKPEGFINDS